MRADCQGVVCPSSTPGSARVAGHIWPLYLSGRLLIVKLLALIIIPVLVLVRVRVIARAYQRLQYSQYAGARPCHPPVPWVLSRRGRRPRCFRYFSKNSPALAPAHRRSCLGDGECLRVTGGNSPNYIEVVPVSHFRMACKNSAAACKFLCCCRILQSSSRGRW